MGNNYSQLRKKTSKQLLKEWPVVEDEECILGDEYVDRQHTHHFLRNYVFQSNFSSPVEEKLIQGCDVLDVGCGPGTWLLDLANKYKNSRFYGLDIKPLFPQKIKPSNLKFIKADIFNGLPFCDNKFEFVHIEMLSIELTRDQLNSTYPELIRVVKPGGYIETSEMGYVEMKAKDSTIGKLQQTLNDVFLKRNIDLKSIPNLDLLESQQNIGKIFTEERKFLYGPKGGKIGLAYQDVMYSFHSEKTMIEAFINEMGISEVEFKNMLKIAKEELKRLNVEGLLMRTWTQKIINN